MKHHALKLYDYHVWANHKVFQHLKQLSREAYRTEINNVFPSVHDAFAHIYRVDNLWLAAMAKESFDVIMGLISQWLEETQGKSIEEMELLFTDLSKKYSAFLERQDMEAVSAYPHPQFGTLNASYADIVQHVVNHGTYHRGNITSMLRQIGHPGTPTDYAFFLYGVNE